MELDVSYHPLSDPSRTLNSSIDNVEFQTSSVPEPSSVALIIVGVSGKAIVRRRFTSERSPAIRPPHFKVVLRAVHNAAHPHRRKFLMHYALAYVRRRPRNGPRTAQSRFPAR